jgi:hypothetical protein
LPDAIAYKYRGRSYYLRVCGGEVEKQDSCMKICPIAEKMTFIIETE